MGTSPKFNQLWAIIRVWGIIPTNYFRLGYNSSMGLNSSRGYNSREYGSCKYESRNFPSKRSDCKRVVKDREVLQWPGLLGRVGTGPGLHKEVDIRVQVGKVLL